jgi:hypothetical protein
MSGGQVRIQGQRETEKNFLKKQFYKTSTATGQLVFFLAENSKVVADQGIMAILEKFRMNHNIKNEKLTVEEVRASIPYIVDTVYQPLEKRLFDRNLATYLNTWNEPFVQASEDLDHEMVRPPMWEEFLSRWFPLQDEKEYFEKWLALTIRDPLAQCDVAVVLRSEQGLGKNFLFDQVVMPMVGEDNAPTVALKQLTDKFAGDLFSSTVILVDEVYETDAKKTADKLKGLITGRTQRGEVKYAQAKIVKTFFNIIITSNSVRPIHIEEDDRRYFVPQFICHKKDKEETAKYLESFVFWLKSEGGLQILRDWFEVLKVEEHLFATAKMTAAKEEITAKDRTADYKAELGQWLRGKREDWVFATTQLQTDKFKFVSAHDIALVLKDEGFEQVRLDSNKKLRVWMHPSWQECHRGEGMRIWSLSASTLR